MKCLWLLQPWASLVAIGAKSWETRSWSTTYRGPLCIGASKSSVEVDYWFYQPLFREAFKAAGITSPVDLPYGKALCVVDLRGCYHTESMDGRISVTERAFGNYEPGRFAWKLADVRRFSFPFAMRGMQGLFESPFPIVDPAEKANK